ncbi:hypothetical protein SAMN05444001_11187 [Parabacteroides chinchillae]|uniref:MacB-like core domain-containing protein n=1 Tax=Parabacteroides chinchillae TaxID=871327 RepID=A0A8G2BX64_9BACT|nr:hypothetical protein SAMN05444001_11187 [Parabacteroides chinchillae]
MKSIFRNLYNVFQRSKRAMIINVLGLSVAFAIIIVAGINFMNMSMALIPKRMKSINIHKY